MGPALSSTWNWKPLRRKASRCSRMTSSSIAESSMARGAMSRCSWMVVVACCGCSVGLDWVWVWCDERPWGCRTTAHLSRHNWTTSHLEPLEVELLVAGVLVEDEDVRADARDDEAEVELFCCWGIRFV